MLETFPKAEIHCFEPVSPTFAMLQRNLSGTRCRCIHSAVGNGVGEARISVGRNSLTNSLVNTRDGDAFETVPVTTVDAYREERSLSNVDLLKIDAERFDLNVLEGAASSFSVPLQSRSPILPRSRTASCSSATLATRRRSASRL